MNRFLIAPLAVALLAVSQTVSAQQPIGAGSLIQQVPPAPVLEKAAPELPIQPRAAPAAAVPAGASFTVRSLRVTGQTHFSEAELIAATGFQPGRTLTLPELQEMAGKITDHYNQGGYFVAQAYLPAQDITDGTVTIAVVEGRYGNIGVRNQTNVSNGVLTGVLDGLNSGDPVDIAPLERRLLLLSDLPGVEVKSTMSPGSEVGTSDLVIDVTPGQRVTGSLEASNWGNPFTGEYLLGGTVNLNEPFGLGDVLSLRVLGSTTGGLGYARASYQAQVKDATVGIAFTAFHYRLGKQFSSLKASGSEEIVSVYGSYPLIRSYNDNLNFVADFDYRMFQDTIGVTSTTTDKQAEVLIAGLAGDHHDTFGGGGWSAYYLTGTFGNLNIQSSGARASDAASARTNGPYAKLSASVSRLQTLFGPLSLYGSIRGQVASKNLDISEKMELGGPNAVRAYPEGEAYGDQGYVASLELRWLLPHWPESLPGRVQLIGFVDTGHVQLNKSPWVNGPNDATRSGAGVGITWAAPNNFVVTVGYAHRLGNARSTSTPDSPGRVWFQVVKYF